MARRSGAEAAVTAPTPLSALAATLHLAVARSRLTRIPVEELRQSALAADLSLTGSPDARARLADAIRELEAAGVVKLPRTGAGWEQLPRPPLPKWVARPVEQRAEQPVEPAVSWHALLHWVPAFLATERPARTEWTLLRAVNGFLGAGGSRVVVPLRERSLQLTGDEKALDTMTRGRLFGPGRLSLQLLSARRVSPPVVRQQVGAGAVTLVVENYATHHSLAATLPADGEVGAVVYGAGNTLGTVLTALADEGGLGALAYFGDLDVRGLEIAAAGTRLASELGLPPLVPARRLYQQLVDHGRPAPAETRASREKVEAAVTWLPAPLRPRVLEVLLSGDRLAQEAVGLELLSTEPRLGSIT
jgi:hypothetical protein